MKKLLNILLLSTLLLSSLHAKPEDELKQVYIEKLSYFITWPQKQKKFSICVYNDKNFALKTKKRYETKKLNKLDVEVTNILIGEENIEQYNCNLLYLRNTDE